MDIDTKNLKKLLKSIEVCEKPGRIGCNGCPLDKEDTKLVPCGTRQYILAKSLLRQMEYPEFTLAHYINDSIKAIIFDPATRDILMELWNDGGDIIVGYKPVEGCDAWVVGHVAAFDLANVSITVVGIDTGFVNNFCLNHASRLIKWTGGPTTDLICTNAIGTLFKIGKCYHIRDGKLIVSQSEKALAADDCRFASLEDGFIKEHFVEYKGDHGIKDEHYLNGWLICTEGDAILKVSAGRRYRICYGDFVDDCGDLHRSFKDSARDMDTLKYVWHFVYVPDDE